MVEWSIVAVVVLALYWAFDHQVQLVRGQGERAAVQATLGVLRTALVLDHITRQVAAPGPGASPPSRNPFLLLQTVPINFAGEGSVARIDRVPPGSWVFDTDCVCVGYRLLYPQWLEEPRGNEAVWFRVGGVGGLLEMNPFVSYVWLGQVLR